MPSYTPPLRDMQFVLHELLEVETQLRKLPQHSDIDAATIDSVLEEGGRFCAEVLFPLNQVGDREGCSYHGDGVVTAPTGFKEAYAQFIEAGWPSLGADPQYGGQGLPHVVHSAFMEMMNSANQAWSMYPGLSHGAYNALSAFGTAEQKAVYLPKLVSGEWTGTMCLTEAHAGTDLGMLRARAEPQADGSYAITGTKIFISAGEHDMSENIVHMVLAKRTGAPDNVKGISLFVVPKYLVNEDGSPGERNKVSCGSIEKKMGIHGNATCVLNYDGAKGWLVGEPEKGLAAMFIMVNAARLGVGLQGVAQGEVAYQNAVQYARERRQGKALRQEEREEGAKADPLFVHPDVRRMLMQIRAWNEGARALVLWGALQVDLMRRSPDEKSRLAAEDLLAVITPVIKGYLTDKGFQATVLAQQVFGGHGYIREHGMEQFVRDARIAMIYEGANGIQAMDLVGRKLPKDGGRAIRAFFELVGGEIAEAKAAGDPAGVATALEPVLQDLQAATMWLAQNGMKDPNNAGAGAYPYMELMGLTTLGWMWMKMAQVSSKALEEGSGDRQFHEAKLATARFYAKRELVESSSLRRKIEAGAETVMALPEEVF